MSPCDGGPEPSKPPVPAASSVADYARLAQARLDAAAWRYLCEGDDGSGSAALADVALTPRPLRDLRGGHTRLTLLGQLLDHPVVAAPIAYQRLFHAEGEAGTAMAAAAQGGQSVISSLASQAFADIVSAARIGGGPAPWFQLYWQGSRRATLHLLARAQAAGCSAVVFTVDAAVKTATLDLPPDVHAVNLDPPAPLPQGGSQVFDGWMAVAPTWDDVRWLRGQTSLPLVLKGILHADDAARAMDIGCDAVVVSSHGGRVLRGTVDPLDALDAVVARVDLQMPVLFDSGIRSGRDVFVALARGATAVLAGRPCIWGLAADGALGVAHVLRLLRDELELTMAQCGCRDLVDVASSTVPVRQGRKHRTMP